MIKDNIRVAIFGLGHIGLPTAALFARSGLPVIGVARDRNKLNLINQGRSPIKEPGLYTILDDAVRSGKLKATDDELKAVEESNVVLVIVPTPMDGTNCSDLEAVKSTCETITRGLKKDDLAVIESTVPPGTCDNLVAPVLEESVLKAGRDFGLAYTPERALPTNTSMR